MRRKAKTRSAGAVCKTVGGAMHEDRMTSTQTHAAKSATSTVLCRATQGDARTHHGRHHHHVVV